MIVLCLEGCHGSGKTQLCKQFASAGFEVLDEAFLDMPAVSLHPQSLTMENFWVSHWIMRLLRKDTELKAQGISTKNQLFIADRSPFSAVFYAQNGHLLEPVIRASLQELREKADIEVYNICVKVDRDILWSRIQSRLQREPERRKYNEDSQEWMDKVRDFYDHYPWDFVVENNEITLQNLMLQLISQLSAKLPSFQRSVANLKLDSCYHDALVKAGTTAGAASLIVPLHM